MQRMKKATWIAVVTLAVSGCASPKQETSIGFARQPQLKSGKSATASNRKQEQPPETPRILPETYYAAGRVFEQQGAPERAIEQYRKAIAVNHEHIAAHARLGLMLSLTGQHEESVSAFIRAVQLKPGSAILRNNLGFELLYLQRWDEAERHLREAGRLDAKLSQAHINLGLLLGRTQRPDQAVEAFRTVLPEADAYYNLGLLQRAQGQYGQALATFRRVLAINPKFTAAQRQLTQVERKVVVTEPRIDQPSITPTVEQTASITGTQIPEIGGETPTPTNTPITEVNTFVDLSALIGDLFLSSTTLESDPTINESTISHPVSTSTIVQTASNSLLLGAPTIIKNEPILQPDTTPPSGIITREETIKQTGTTDTKEAIGEEPSAEAVPVNQGDIIDAPQPLRWDLTLADMARALNIADNQQGCIEELTAISGQLGPVPAQLDTVADTTIGPPAPQDDKVVLVLGTGETRSEDLPETIASKRPTLTTMPELSIESVRSIRALDEMEISLQIIRNEIDCQKEFGFSNSDGAAPTISTQLVPVHYTPIEAPQTLEQRTQFWKSQFGVLENLLASVYSKTSSANESVVVAPTGATPESKVAEQQVESNNNDGPPTLAAPTQKPRRHRSSGSRSSRR